MSRSAHCLNFLETRGEAELSTSTQKVAPAENGLASPQFTHPCQCCLGLCVADPTPIFRQPTWQFAASGEGNYLEVHDYRVVSPALQIFIAMKEESELPPRRMAASITSRLHTLTATCLFRWEAQSDRGARVAFGGEAREEGFP